MSSSQCDNDPTNDCIKDWNEIWGGSASLDECGTCDNDPNNNCAKDCNNVLGGDAEKNHDLEAICHMTRRSKLNLEQRVK